MTVLRVVLPSHLNKGISSLKGCNKQKDIIFMCELLEDFTHVKHHKKKIAFLLSAMRHFAEELKEDKYPLIYKTLDDKDNSGNLTEDVKKVVQEKSITKIIISYPPDYRTLKYIQSWEKELGIHVDLLEDDLFLSRPQEFHDWSKDRKELRMEYFYRELRKKHSILMDGDQPVGAQWNYDSQNRNPLKEAIKIPKSYESKPDEISKGVMDLVQEKFSDHFGDLEPFYFAVTRRQALQALETFMTQRLKNFGDYQDAMAQNEPWLFHSHISFYLNCSLLTPLECIQKAEKAYQKGNAPLNAVEGFIRQILGWREYIRGVYWTKMPDCKQENFLKAKRPLPDFFWGASTKMNCLFQCVSETKKNAYAHHIQRLMVLGNFCLLAGIDPDEVNEWYLIVYADAFEWVELPNVTGMILFADGGYLASKPYAASGNYIHKMSNYCESCHYNVKEKNGKTACPFNYLYWNFLLEHEEKLSKNPRLGMPYRTLSNMTQEKKDQIQKDSNDFFDSIHPPG